MVRTRSLAVGTRSLAVATAHVALATEPECLGPCEPGTSVNLEGIVWQETEDGEPSAALVVAMLTCNDNLIAPLCSTVVVLYQP